MASFPPIFPGPYVPPFRPLSNITPFTYTDGATYLEVLEELRVYVNETLVTFINDNFGSLDESFTTEVNRMITEVTTMLDEQNTSVFNQLTALTSYVDEKVQEVIDSSIETQDSVVATNINNPASLTRLALDDFFVPLSLTEIGRLSESNLDAAYADKSIETMATSGRLSETELDAAYADKSIETMATSGRLSETELDAAYSDKSIETMATSGRLSVSELNAAYSLKSVEYQVNTRGINGITFTDSGDIVTIPNHNLTINDSVAFTGITTTTGVINDTLYDVRSIVNANQITINYYNTNTIVPLTNNGTATTVWVYPRLSKLTMDNDYTPINLSGTYAARPAANTVRPGTIYYCTNVPEIYRSNGATWSVFGPGGNELGVAIKAATSSSTTSTSAVDIPGMSITFVAGERPIRFSYMAELNSTVAGAVVVYFVVNGSTVSQSGYNLATASKSLNVYGECRVTGLTAGNTYTAKLQFAVSSGTGTFGSAFSQSLATVTTL